MTSLPRLPTMALLAPLLLAGCIVVPVPTGVGVTPRPVDLSPAPNACPVTAETRSTAAPGLAGLNAARQAAGLAPLSLSNRLTAVAQDHSCDQAVTMRMGHVGSDGSSLGQRMARGAVPGRAFAENVGMGLPTAEAMVAGWMNSAPHRANILNPAYRAVGLAVSRDVAGRPYWTLTLTD